MPTRNLGPCACCKTRYAIGFRVVEIGGYFSGLAGPIGMRVEWEQDGEVVFRVEFSDGTFEDRAFISGSVVGNETAPSSTTLSGTFDWEGTDYPWSLTWGWGVYPGTSIYRPVAECNQWFAYGTRADGYQMPDSAFSNVLWTFER